MKGFARMVAQRFGLGTVLAGMLAGGAHGASGPEAYALRQADKIATPDDLEESVWLHGSSESGTKEKVIARLMQKQPDSAYAHFLMAELNLRRYLAEPLDLSLLKTASELGQQAIELAPDKEWGYIVIAQILDVMGQNGNARKVLTLADPTLASRSWRFTFVRGLMASEQGDADATVGFFMKSLDAKDSLGDVVMPALVEALRKAKEGAALERALADLAAKHPHHAVTFAQAEAAEAMGKHAEAHAFYQAVHKARPDHWEAKVADAAIMDRNLGDRRGAQALLESVIKAGAGLPDALAAESHRHLGAIALADRRAKDAESHFVRAVSLADPKGPVITATVDQYRGQKMFGELARFLAALNEANPGNGLQHALLGETLSQNLKKHREAVTAFSSAIVLEPDRSEFYTGMGLAYYRQNDWENALRLFSNAVKVDPRDAVARYNEACAFARLGKARNAMECLRVAIQLDPKLKAQAAADDDFAKLRTTTAFAEAMNPTTARRAPETALDYSFGH